VAEVMLVWDETAIALLAHDPAVAATVARVAGRAVNIMKALTPVSPVYPVYAQPVPPGRSTGPVYGGAGETHKGVRRKTGPPRARTRYPGDLPLQVSGNLRRSITAVRAGDAVLIGPDPAKADYGQYVNDGTRRHDIRSTGPWPLRNRATGQVFGPLVHHPGTRGAHFIERTAQALDGQRERV
jgi:hypothetical protein